MILNFKVPQDSGGSPLTKYELFMNDGNDANDPATPITSYTDNALTYTLTAATEGMVLGKIYKFRFRATNIINNSEYSDIVRYGLIEPPAAPSAPTVMLAMTNTT
jgi:hypothetical protein